MSHQDSGGKSSDLSPSSPFFLQAFPVAFLSPTLLVTLEMMEAGSWDDLSDVPVFVFGLSISKFGLFLKLRGHSTFGIL